MDYSEFLAVKREYDNILEKRLSSYLEIAKTEKAMYARSDEDVRILTYFSHSGASEYLTEDTTNEHVDYGYEIELSFDIHYSGCGTDTHSIYLPHWILLGDDLEYNTALNDFRDSIHDKNQEIADLIAAEKKAEVKTKESEKNERDRKEYERLAKMFGEEK